MTTIFDNYYAIRTIFYEFYILYRREQNKASRYVLLFIYTTLQFIKVIKACIHIQRPDLIGNSPVEI